METIISQKFLINDDLGLGHIKDIEMLSFQGLFTSLRKTLDVKYTRKLHIDSILKKCKGRFFKAINECVKKCLRINVPKFPQNFITNISIEYNQKFLDFTMGDLFSYFHLLPYSLDDIMEKNYCYKEKEIYLKYIFLSKMGSLYFQYIQSKQYKRMIDLIKTKKGIKIAKLYQFVSDNFINYYVFSRAHIKKSNKNGETEQNSNLEQSNDNINNNEKSPSSKEDSLVLINT
jgi:hypothetical protein